MISKELLSEVLKNEKFIREFCVSDNTIRINPRYRFDDNEMVEYGCEQTINIYELAYRCKEWAINKKCALVSYGKECFLYETEKLYDVSEQLDKWSEWFEAETEPKAIFKSCEWILNNLKDKT